MPNVCVLESASRRIEEEAALARADTERLRAGHAAPPKGKTEERFLSAYGSEATVRAKGNSFLVTTQVGGQDVRIRFAGDKAQVRTPDSSRTYRRTKEGWKPVGPREQPASHAAVVRGLDRTASEVGQRPLTPVDGFFRNVAIRVIANNGLRMIEDRITERRASVRNLLPSFDRDASQMSRHLDGLAQRRKMLNAAALMLIRKPEPLEYDKDGVSLLSKHQDSLLRQSESVGWRLQQKALKMLKFLISDEARCALSEAERLEFTVRALGHLSKSPSGATWLAHQLVGMAYGKKKVYLAKALDLGAKSVEAVTRIYVAVAAAVAVRQGAHTVAVEKHFQRLIHAAHGSAKARGAMSVITGITTLFAEASHLAQDPKAAAEVTRALAEGTAGAMELFGKNLKALAPAISALEFGGNLYGAVATGISLYREGNTGASLALKTGAMGCELGAAAASIGGTFGGPVGALALTGIAFVLSMFAGAFEESALRRFLREEGFAR
jgi:hypothetical protein